VGVTEHNINGVLAGEGLDVFMDALTTHYKQQMLENLHEWLMPSFSYVWFGSFSYQV